MSVASYDGEPSSPCEGRERMMLGVDEPICGVNLGNWLVLEKWMSPGLFSDCGEDDEIWMHRSMDPQRLKVKLKQHRDKYIRFEDFEAIAEHGYNLVRLPVPYFVFGDAEGHPGCIAYVDDALRWANKTGLKVLLDLHTVPESQNGFDNGGLIGVCKWHKDPEAVEYVLNVLARLARRYRDDEALYGIEVLNEPANRRAYVTSPSTGQAKDKDEAEGSGYIPLGFLKDFYRAAYRRLRPILRDENMIVFHDGFRLRSWGNWFNRQSMRNVMLDTHVYIHTLEQFMPLRNMLVYKWYIAYNKWIVARAARHTPVVVGEWNIVNDLADRKADGAGEDAALVRRDIYRQIAGFELSAWKVCAGHIYWSYRLKRNWRDVDPDGSEGSEDFEAWDLTRVWAHHWMGDGRRKR